MRVRIEEGNAKASIFCFLLGLSIIFFLVLNQGCATRSPSVDVSFWSGDSLKVGITRAQPGGRTISCSDLEFNSYVCLTYDDVRKLYLSIQGGSPTCP